MRITVFGASGGVGREIVSQGLALGHDLVGVARSPSREPKAAWVQGDPLNPVVVQSAVDGAEVVLSALGIKRKHPANPWSALASPPDFASKTATLIAEAMKAAGATRVIAVSAGGVGDSWSKLDPFVRAFIASTNIAPMFEDLARMEAVWDASGLDWCCARPVKLRDGPRTGEIVHVDHFGTATSITRGDVAAWMLEMATRPEISVRTPMIASAESAGRRARRASVERQVPRHAVVREREDRAATR
jgi:putative NADH-flavin reductase